MKGKIRILFLSSNPWTTSRILVDEEMREIFEKLQEGPCRDRFELHRHAATRPIDLQRLLMMYKPHIVHFAGHGSKKHKIILGGKPGRGKHVDQEGLAKMFALYKKHVRLVVLNACFTKTQAEALSEAIDYSVGAGKGIGDKEGVAFAGAFYRALSFGKSVKTAFQSAKAELDLTKMARTKGIGIFVRKGLAAKDSFPRTPPDPPRKHIPSPRTKTGAPRPALMRLADKVSHSAPASMRNAKQAVGDNANPILDAIDPQSSMKGARTFVTLTVKVFKVEISDSNFLSQTLSGRTDGADRARAQRANKLPSRGRRSGSD